MILVVGTIRIAPGTLALVLPAMRAMAEASRGEGGCLAYHYAADVLEPGLIHVVERWTDREALAAHFATPHLAAWRAQWPALGITDRRLCLIEGAPEEI
ncbi:antibiotic biosynthesis monooxygenase [alpha proteobacterium AAP81b]|nr:antibiotic biosynthesis monooxygenase [alpha proteobacterium AAP81b]